jgi:hypothetical protein
VILQPLHLLVGGAVLHLGYAAAPLDAQPMAWNALGALARLMLVLAMVYPIASPAMGAVVAWLAAEELQVVVCNTAFAIRPWEIKAGHEMCSSMIGHDISKYTAVVVIGLLAYLYPTNVARYP